VFAAIASWADVLKFQFDSSEALPGFTRVWPTNLFNEQAGFGFDLGTGVTNNVPYIFSVAVPEGNYRVSVTLGDAREASTNTVKAESRRLMVERVVTAAGEFMTRSFTVNVRTPRLGPERAVKLKPREQGVLHWDDKLTLDFNGSQPRVRTVEISPVTNVTTVFLAGDSTVTDQPDEPWNSWGQMLTRFFSADVAVANHAESGESLKSSLAARRIEKILTTMKPGDFLFVQFGHNDMKDRATNAVATFYANLKQLIADTRSRGATLVLVTSMERKAGVTKDTLTDYPRTMREVAQADGVALIDLHAMSKKVYAALGADLDKAFVDGTHHNAYGSYEMARCVMQGIRDLKLPLAKFIAADVGEFNPAKPDPLTSFNMPASSNKSAVKPDGN
jgi:lysophospholipase L1-like esterase